MDVTRIVLRLIHIFGGVFWVGGAWMMSTYIGSTAKTLGEDAAKFMQHFTLRSGFARTLAISSGLTVISGLWLYWINFGDTIELSTGRGLALSFGGLFGLMAFLIAIFRITPTIRKMRDLVDSFAEKKGPPSKEDLGQLRGYQERVAMAGSVGSVLMVFSLIGMTLSEWFGI